MICCDSAVITALQIMPLRSFHTFIVINSSYSINYDYPPRFPLASHPKLTLPVETNLLTNTAEILLCYDQ